jgi:pimeloyl-ACP methyl ester carboxylesterase
MAPDAAGEQAPETGRVTLTDNDKRALKLIERGEVGAACALPVPTRASETEALPEEGHGNLQDRLRLGEDLLGQLGLTPETPAADGDQQTRSGLILLRSPGAERLTLVFNGNTINFAVPHALAADRTTHVAIMRDPSRCFGFLGIPELGADYDACLVNLRRIADALGVTQIYCIGMSAGGSTAIRYGCDLNVQGVLGFSVPTTLDLDDDPGAELRHYPQLTKLYKYGRQFGIDLGRYYKSRSPRPGMMLVFSQSHIRDAWLAERMRGIEGVELVATEGFDGHKTFRWLQQTGSLSGFLERLFALEPVHPTSNDDATTVQAPSATRRQLDTPVDSQIGS